MAGDIRMVRSADTLIEKVEESLREVPYEYPQTLQNYDGTYLFFSFDLVNSTAFKNKNKRWGEIFDQFFSYCKGEMRKAFPSAVPWKMIGDEILFYLRVTREIELYEAPEKTFDILGKCIKFISEKLDAKSSLSVKATLWAAAMYSSADNVTNRIIIESDFDKDILDFLGPDIDIGFRISEYALKSILVIEAKLACLLTKLETELYKEHISTHMRIVSYEQLKGVWDGRYYPIVWYRDDWTYSPNMFVYDEKYYSKIVHQIQATKGECLEDASHLTKIFVDLNRISEIQILKDNINAKEDAVRVPIKISRDKLGELHIVAICVNSNNEILVAKRTEKDTLPNRWEFGCGQLHINQDFISAINEGYKSDFGITLEFIGNNNENPIPIGTYIVKKPKENDRTVPGIIFICRIVSGEDNIILDDSKHSEYKFVNKESYKEINEDSVPDFEKRILDTYSLLEQQEESSNAR
jgi:hypothetical protein